MRLIILIRLAALLFLGLCTTLVGQAVSAADYTPLTTLRFDWAQEKTAQTLTVASRDGTVQMTFQPNGVLSRLALDGKNALGISRPVLALRDNTHDLTSAVNLVPNPGFEQGLDGWAVDGPSEVTIGSEASTGTQSLQLGEFSGTTRVLSSRLSVDDGKSYVLSLFLKTSYGFLIDVNAAYVIWYDDSGDELSVSSPLRLYGSSHEWMRFSSRLSPPPGAAQAAVLVRYARNSQYPATTPISSPPTQILWIDDVALYETPASMRPETLRGTLTDAGNGALRLTGASSGGIEVTATFTPEEHDVHVDVSLFAADGAPRAVDLLFSVPVTGTEPLTWEEHPRSRKPIEARSRHENTVEGVQKTDQAISNYPFSSVSAPSFGLSLGTNMARPALFKGFFDAQDNSLNLQYYLGLSPLPEKFPNQASVSLIVFAHDPLWGFRSAADIYTEEIFPSYFHGMAAGQEPIGNGPNGPLQFQQNINDWQDFGFVGNARLAPWKYSLTHDDWVQLIQQNDADNILNTLYSVPSEDFMYRDAFGTMSQTPQPSYDLFQGWLAHDALAGNYDAVATLASGARASNGDYLIRSIGSVSHENDKWTIDVRRDPDEELNEGQPCNATRCTQNQLTRREVLADMQGFIDEGAIVDGIFLDNFQIAGMLDFEPTHLRYADYPLTYDLNTFQPALSTILYDREYLDWQRAYLDQAYPESYKLIEANFYGMGREMFLAPLLDVFSSEGVPHDGGWQIGWHDDTGNYAWGYENYILKRFYGQNKAIRYYRFVNTFGGEVLDCSREALEGTMKYLAFYGIYLNNGCLMQSSPENPEQKVFERDRDLYQKYVVQMEKPLVRLGWQPLTLAEIDDPSLYLERWGGRPGQDLAFSLRNENPAASPYTLDIPFRDFGISDPPPILSVRELTSGQDVAFTIVFGKTMPQTGMVKDVIEVSGVLAPEDTVAYYLTTSLPSQTPTPTATATPTPTATSTATPATTATSSPTPAVTSTATPPASQCVGDTNANGIGDVVDVMTTASEPGCRAYLPLVIANWRQPWPTATPTPSPTQACECTGPGGCGATPTPQQTLSKLAMVEANEYWIAYESPTQYALSLAWAGDSLWMADLFKGIFYKVQEGEDGLTIIDTVKVRRDPFMQARDLTWDGDNLWSVHWGDLIRHDMTDPELGADLWINEGEIGAPNLHHLKAIAWDGEFIWSALDGTIHRHNKTDFEVAETFQVSGAFSPAGMAFREGDLWVANRSGGFIDRLDSNSFTLLDRYSIVQQPFGLAWSDSNLWVYDWYTNRIYKILKLPATSLDPEDDYLTTENYTQPEAIIRGQVTWTRAASPYVVSDLAIERGATLTIEPGVTVYVRGESPISVQGVLTAVGTPDSEIIFTHQRPNQVWGGLYFSGEEANASVLEHVRIQYADDGIKGVDAAPHRIAYSVIRKVNVYGLRFELGAGNYGTLEITGNRIEQGAGGAIKVILRSPASRIDRVAIRGNTFRFWYTAGPIIESEVQELSFPPEIVVERNIFENGYRGAGGGFPAAGNVAFHDNHLRNSISGSGVQPFHGGNVITNNLIEYTFEAAYELHPGHFVTSTTVRGNTVRGALAGFDHNWGDLTIVVEQNNLLAPEDMAFWTGGVGGTDGGYDVEMRRNWWGTDDLSAIRAHIFDRLWIEENDPENTDVMGTVWIEPVLTEPNGIGFIRGRVLDRNSGRPISSATITLDGEILYSSANGEFFTSAPQGPAHLTVGSPGRAVTEYDVRVCSGTATNITAELERDP